MKNILRILSLICIVFVFIPSFVVSCSGQEININVLTAVELLIPAAFIILTFVRKISDKKISFTIAIGALIDIVIWFVFKSNVAQIAKNYNCEFRTTIWYYFNTISQLAILGISVYQGFIKKNMPVSPLSANITQTVLTTHPNPDFIGYCTKCGKGILEGYLFCTACGAKISETILKTGHNLESVEKGDESTAVEPLQVDDIVVPDIKGGK